MTSCGIDPKRGVPLEVDSIRQAVAPSCALEPCSALPGREKSPREGKRDPVPGNRRPNRLCPHPWVNCCCAANWTSPARHTAGASSLGRCRLADTGTARGVISGCKKTRDSPLSHVIGTRRNAIMPPRASLLASVQGCVAPPLTNHSPRKLPNARPPPPCQHQSGPVQASSPGPFPSGFQMAETRFPI